MSLTVYYFCSKISSFIPILFIRIVLDSFYLLVFYSEKFSTWISLLPFDVNANLNLSNWNFAARKWKQARKPSGCSFFLSFSFFIFDDIIGRLKLSFVAQFLTYNNCEISLDSWYLCQLSLKIMLLLTHTYALKLFIKGKSNLCPHLVEFFLEK